MRALMSCWRLIRVAAHVLHGLLIVLLRFGSLSAAERQARIQWWSSALLQHLGVKLVVQGAAIPGAGLLVANHVSWLDITSLHSACPQARFVSKADVLGWPLLGRLIRAGGTLFIQRERKRDAMRVVHEMAAAIRAGDLVAVFPEGTTGTGTPLLPFHANLLQAAVAVEAHVQPVAVRYFESGQRFSVSAQWVGDTTLVQSIWRIVTARDLGVEVRFLPPVAAAQLERRVLAEQLRDLIQAELDQG